MYLPQGRGKATVMGCNEFGLCVQSEGVDGAEVIGAADKAQLDRAGVRRVFLEKIPKAAVPSQTPRASEYEVILPKFG